jgi:hypothetical protein
MVTICHATGSETNPYVLMEVNAAGVVNGHLGDDHQNGEDIIPEFTFRDETYGPQGDQSILENDCVVPTGDGGGGGGGGDGDGGDGGGGGGDGDGGGGDGDGGGGDGDGAGVAGDGAGEATAGTPPTTEAGGAGAETPAPGPIPRAVDAGQQSVSGWQLPVGAALTALGLLGGLVTTLRRTTAAS